METILLEITNDKAYKLIEDLEALDIVKVLKKTTGARGSLSGRFACALNLSEKEYNELQHSLSQSRDEWERDI